MVINKLEEELAQQEIDFEIIHHEVAIKSKEDAKGLFSTKQTAPTLILKTEIDFYALIISGEREKIDFKELKELLACRKVEMAKKEDIADKLGLEVGKVPLIGHHLPSIIDRKLLQYNWIYGGTGDWNYTLKIDPNDLIRVNHVIHYWG